MRHTKRFRQLAALVATIVVASCAVENDPIAPPPPQHGLIGNTVTTVANLAGTLLKCTPLPFDSDSALIGPAGGFVQMGPATLVIPPLALSQPVWIKGEAPSDTVNSVRFKPEGLVFNRPAALVVSYANCNLVAGLLTPKKVAYTTDALQILSYQPTLDNIFARVVTARIDHFSRYAVGW